MEFMILLPIVLPILAGIVLLLLPDRLFNNRNRLIVVVGILIVISAVSTLLVSSGLFGDTLTLFRLVDDIPVYFSIDNLGRLFSIMVMIVLTMAGIFSFGYMEHEKNEKRYYGFFLIVYGVLMGLDYSGNIITMYMFYELMTLTSVPLVMHEGTREAVIAGLKYMFFSFCGAYMALYGIYFLNQYTATLNFTAGGTLDINAVNAAGNSGFMLVVCFLIVLGFGVKAGMFPLHSWLPTAHPVAPAPASAALSGIIVKSGVLAIIRTIFYCVGADFIRNTWVQTVWLILALITVLMGSALAFKEQILKKRFAYSTVSNLSYILFGVALLNPIGLTGAILHVVCHAVIKCGLFLTAGLIIVHTGKKRVAETAGLGHKMPITFWCFIILSLGLIGIPPTAGVVSKWYLCIGALDSNLQVFSWFGPVVLLISALLTAGYLLPIGIKAFLVKSEDDTGKISYTQEELEENEIMKALSEDEEHHKNAQGTVPRQLPAIILMLIPIIVLTILSVFIGLFPTAIVDFISDIAAQIL